MRGHELKDMRVRAGFTARTLAEHLQVTPSTLSRYERDKRPIPKVVALAVRQVCEPRMAPKSVGERLIEAMKEALDHASLEPDRNA